MLKGTAASEGIGIGKVLVIKEVSLAYTPHAVEDTAAEKARFKDAVAAFIADTKEKMEALKQSAGEKEALIMQGHISMIEDPFLQSETEKRIDGGECAEAALEAICDMFIGMFSAVEDEMMRQRAADVRDVKSFCISR